MEATRTTGPTRAADRDPQALERRRTEGAGQAPKPGGGHRRAGRCEGHGRGGGRFAALLRGRDGPAEGGKAPPEAGLRDVPGPRGEGDEPAILGVLRELGGRGRPDADGGTGEEREPAGGRDRGDRTLDLAPFQPPPPALQLPPGQAAAQPAATGSAQAHAEAAALADRLVTSMRVGRVGKDGHEVRMQLALRRDAGLEVRLRLDGAGRLTALLVGEPGHRADATRLADALERELAARGLELDAVEVE